MKRAPLIRCLVVLLVLAMQTPMRAQEFVIRRQVKLEGIADDYMLSPDAKVLYVNENGLLQAYDWQSGRKIKTLDTLRFRRFPIFCGSKFVQQDKQNLHFIDPDTRQDTRIPFEGMLITYAVTDSSQQLWAVANVKSRNGIFLLDRMGIAAALPLPDTTRPYIGKLALSPGGQYLAVQLLNEKYEFDDLLIFDTRTKAVIGRVGPDEGRDFVFQPHGPGLYCNDAWGAVSAYAVDSSARRTDALYSEDDIDTLGIESIRSFTFLPLGWIVTASKHGVFSLWSMDRDIKQYSTMLPISPVSLKPLPGENMVLASAKDSFIYLIAIPPLPEPDSPLAVRLVVQTKHADRITTILDNPVANQLYTYNGYNGIGDIKVWDRSSLMQLRTFEKTDLQRISSDYRYLIGRDNIIDLETLTRVTPPYFKHLFGTIYDIDAGLKRMLVEQKDTVSYVDLATGGRLNLLFSYKKYYHEGLGGSPAIALDRTRRLIASAINYSQGSCGNWVIVIHDLNDGHEVQVLKGLDRKNQCVRAMMFGTSLPYLISRVSDTVTIWDIKKGVRLKDLAEQIQPGLADDVYGWALSPDGYSLALGYGSGRITRWDLRTFTRTGEFKLGDWKLVGGLDFLDERTVFLAQENNLHLYDLEKGVELERFGNAQDIHAIDRVLTDEANDRIYSLQHNHLSCWNMSSLLHLKQPLPSLPRYLWDIAFSTDSSAIACTDMQSNPNIYSLRSGGVTTGNTFTLDDGSELQGASALMTRDHRVITLLQHSVERTGSLAIFDSTGRLLKNLWSVMRFDEDYRLPMTLSPREDSIYVVVAVHKAFKGEALLAISLTNYGIRVMRRDMAKGSVTFLRMIDDSLLLMAGNICAVWNVKRSMPMLQSKNLFSSYFDYDPVRHLLFSGNERTVRLWKLDEHMHCVRKFRFPTAITCLTYNKRRRVLITGHSDGTIRCTALEQTEPALTILSIDTSGYIIQTKRGYYYSTRALAPDYIAYEKANKSYLFSQFDNYLNRPDLVLKACWQQDSSEAHLLETVAHKRNEIDLADPNFKLENEIPALGIIGRATVPSITNQSELHLSVKVPAASPAFTRLIIMDNGNRIGVRVLTAAQKSVTVPVEIELNEGVNRLKLYAVTATGSRSSLEEVKILYRSPAPGKGRLYFIGIGVDSYPKDTTRKLRFAVKDMRDLQALVQARDREAYTQLFLNGDATREKILAIRAVLEKTTIEDRVVVMASCHGITDARQNYYLGTTNIDFRRPEAAGLSYDSLQALLENIPARKKLLLLDACYSGQIDKRAPAPARQAADDDLEQALAQAKQTVVQSDNQQLSQTTVDYMQELFSDMGRGNGVVVISAARGTGTAEESAEWGNGAFTLCLKAALTGGSSFAVLNSRADKDANGLSINELKQFVLEKVPQLTNNRQQPTMRQENVEYDWKIW
jgi:WD40 repeat protein